MVPAPVPVLGVGVAPSEHAAAAELVAAIHAGDVDALQRIILESPEIVAVPLGGPFKTRTALHVVADWPGYFPNGPQIVRLLVAAGADPNAGSPGGETPLHWAASSDDVDVAAALIEGGADIEVPDGSIGTPLGNAIGYGCWHVAALLAARGARVEKLWLAAALGELASRSCSRPRTSHRRRCPRRSGTRAQPVSDAPPSSYSRPVRN